MVAQFGLFNQAGATKVANIPGAVAQGVEDVQKIRNNDTVDNVNQQKITEAKLKNLHTIAQTLTSPADLPRVLKMGYSIAPEIIQHMEGLPPEQQFQAIKGFGTSSLEDQLKAFDLQYKAQQMGFGQQDQQMQVGKYNMEKQAFENKGKFLPLGASEAATVPNVANNATDAGKTSDDLFGGAAQEGLVEGPVAQTTPTVESAVNPTAPISKKASLYDNAVPGTTDGQSVMQLTDGRVLSQAQFDKEQGRVEKEEKYASNTVKKVTSIIPMLDDAIAAIEGTSTGTGAIGQATGWIGGTPAAKIEGVLDGIRSNLGFDNLTEMRAASPTGGALGQVSDKENNLLQSTKGTLNPKAGKVELLKTLKRIRDGYTEIGKGVGVNIQKDLPRASGGVKFLGYEK